MDLDSWFEDREIQEFIEKLEKKWNKIAIRSNLQNQQTEKKSSTKAIEDLIINWGILMKSAAAGGIKKASKGWDQKQFNEEYFRKLKLVL